MKNLPQLFLSLIIVTTAGLGCSFMSGGSGSSPANETNRSLSDKAIDSTVGREKIGVPECDQVLDEIEAELNNPDDNIVLKAAKATVLNQLKESIRQSAGENANKDDLVRTCREFKKQFDKYKAEQQNSNKK